MVYHLKNQKLDQTQNKTKYIENTVFSVKKIKTVKC